MKIKKDPFTGEMFAPKRNNQMFANRKNQTDFNNQKARKKRDQKKHIDRILDKNREILKSILKNQQSATKNRDFLLGAGFNFNHFSGIFKIENKTVYAIYEFTVLMNENKTFLIEKQ
jgi:hypothetical protein